MKKTKENRVIFEFIQVLEGLEKFLSPPLGINKELLVFVRELRDILAGNEKITSSILLDHIEKLSSEKKKSNVQYGNKINLTKINAMPLADIEVLLSNESLSKNDLMSIAELRFGAPSGTLKRHKISTLREKIMGMVNNEKSHQSIAKVASSISHGVKKGYDQKNQSGDVKDTED